MSVDRLINVLPEITLIEMMVTIGLGVTFSDVLRVSRNYGRVTRALLANYTVVPAAALSPLLLFSCQPNDRRRISWRCGLPGAPYGPPLTAMAKGKVEASVGQMVILAGSSAIVVPPLLQVMLPIVAGGILLRIHVIKMVGTLLGAQLPPLWVGLMESEDRKGMVFATSVRNVGGSLVIMTASFPGTLAMGSATAYALFQTVSDDCHSVSCFGVGQTYASGHRLSEDEGCMNKEVAITYPARYGETAWSPTGQRYRPQSSAEEGEQGARRLANRRQSNDIHQVAASGTKQSAKKRQTPKTQSIR